MEYFDRYARFKSNGEMLPVYGVTLPKADTDKFDIYRKGKSRFDLISNKFYGSPYYGSLILMANPELPGLEFNIPDMTQIRVPFPFKSAVERFINEVEKQKTLYG